MRKIARFCQNAKYIGLLGLPGLIWQLPLFNFFWLFWLLGLLEIVLNFSVFQQNLQIVASMLWVPLKYGKNLPNKDNYQLSVEFSLPFADSWVVVNGGLEKNYSHSWSIPCQRYAYDFLMLDEAANSCSDWSPESTETRSSRNASLYYCYGQDILAPAAGRVVEILDGQPDSLISDKGTADCAARDIRGNYVVIQHEAHLFSTLAHLQQGSFCVCVGDSVIRGQKLAHCGNSGNSSEPHLHFQLQTEKSFFFAAGIPLRFTQIAQTDFNNYGQYDPRPYPTEPFIAGNITRGQTVHNLLCSDYDISVPE